MRHTLYLARPLDPAQHARWLARLSDPERARHDRFRFEKDRALYLTAHALLRDVLGAPAEGWRFEEGEHGRPRLAAETPGPPFNLTHTHGLAAVVTGPCAELGVDAEATDIRGDLLEVAERWFNAEEVAQLRALPHVDRQNRFLSFWTAKEAYLKARGVGLQLPLHQITVDVAAEPTPDAPVPIALRLAAELNDPETDWQLRLLDPTGTHRVVVAARTDRLDLDVQWWSP